MMQVGSFASTIFVVQIQFVMLCIFKLCKRNDIAIVKNQNILHILNLLFSSPISFQSQTSNSSLPIFKQSFYM